MRWTELGDEELLKLRICDLGLSIKDSWLQSLTEKLNSELKAAGLPWTPRYYLGDEWFSPEGLIAIAIPFYLAHPRLMQLEKKFMLEVEGGTEEWCMKLLRHEAGHCFDHAYALEKRRSWAKTFGPPNLDYNPETYRPRPYSKSFVRHLDNWYAQAHPSEDFAETFAVYVTPQSDWREHYKSWHGALTKLEYMDELVKDCARRPPVPASIKFGRLPFNAKNLKMRLDHYYQKRRRENAADYPDFFDGDLKEIFSAKAGEGMPASQFLRRHAKMIVHSVGRWSSEKNFTVERLVKKFSDRSRALELRAPDDHTRVSIEVSSYLASIVSNYLFTGKFKRTV